MKSIFIKPLLMVLALIGNLVISECKAQSKKDDSVVLIDSSVNYEIPMTYELMHIAMALTDTSIASNSYNVYKEVIDIKSDYYKEVMKYFGPFKNHELIQKLNRSLKKSPSNYLTNLQLAYNAIYFENTIKKEKKFPLFHRIAYQIFAVNLKSLKDFAKISSFETFYKKHHNYYNEILKNVQKNANVNQQKIWLEKEFPNKYDSYSLVISPLMGSTHFIKRFSKKGKRKAIMWISNFENDSNQSNNLTTAFYTGTVMTEIDHG